MEIYVKDNKALSLDSKFLSPAVSSETWVLNKSPNVSVDMEFAISFISNGKEFVKLVVNSMKENIKYRGETTNVSVFIYAVISNIPPYRFTPNIHKIA